MSLESMVPNINERAEGQKKDALKEGYHYDNLFDQNEDESGEKRNLATGEVYRNDTDIEAPGVDIVDEEHLENDPLKAEMENDPAEIWLRANDPQYKAFGELRGDEEIEGDHKKAA